MFLFCQLQILRYNVHVVYNYCNMMPDSDQSFLYGAE